MITFKQFLREKNGDDLVTYLRKNCMPAVHDMIAADKYFWRGQKKPLNCFEYKWGEKDVSLTVQAPRDDRLPRDTPKWAHTAVDDYLEKKFGIRARQTSLFTYSSVSSASGYGMPHIIIPYGDYKALWGPNIDDLTVELFPTLEPGETGDEVLPGPTAWWTKYIHAYPNGPSSIPVEDKIERLNSLLDDIRFEYTGGEMALKGALGEILIQCEHYMAIPVGSSSNMLSFSQVKELLYEVASE